MVLWHYSVCSTELERNEITNVKPLAMDIIQLYLQPLHTHTHPPSAMHSRAQHMAIRNDAKSKMSKFSAIHFHLNIYGASSTHSTVKFNSSIAVQNRLSIYVCARWLCYTKIAPKRKYPENAYRCVTYGHSTAS